MRHRWSGSTTRRSKTSTAHGYTGDSMTVSASRERRPQVGRSPRGARRAGPRDRRLAFRSGDRLSVLARLRDEARLGSARARSRASPICKRFGPFEDEWLRGGPVQRWVPQGPGRASRSSSSRPVARPACRRRASRATTSAPTTSCSARRCPTSTFRRASNWLMLGPSGPRRLRLSVEHLAQYRGGICFCVDLDPRWVIKLIKKGWSEHLQAYKDHVIDQAVTILQAGPRHPLHVHDAEAARVAGAAARVDGHDASARRASPASSPAAPSSRRSGTASRTRSCSTART